MRLSILLITLSFIFSMSLSGCSLFGSDDEEKDTATVSQEKEDGGGDEYSYDEFEDGDDSANKEESSADETISITASDSNLDVDTEDSFASGSDVDDYPDDDYLGEKNNSVSSEVVEDSVFVDTGGDEEDIPAETLAGNEEEDLFVKEEAPVVDEPVYAEASDYSEAVADVPMETNVIPVKKMKPAAFQRAGANVNRLYVTRPGDSMDTISQKIYGSDSTNELYSFNPYHKGRNLNVGDKVYYSSPKNPNDGEMKTYYEDMNLAPQYYTSRDGDNIRGISKKLLGHNRSWMEVWATNANVESKGRMPGNIQLRYWPDGSDVQMAKAPTQKPAPEPVPPPVEEQAPEEVQASIEEPEEVEPPADMVDLDEEEPQDIQEIAQIDDPGSIEEPQIEELNEEEEFSPPPATGQVNNPPGGQALAPPPPPPPPPVAQQRMGNPDAASSSFGDGAKDMISAAKDDSMIMGALGGLLILAAIIMLIFIRRSRAKRVNFSQTQV